MLLWILRRGRRQSAESEATRKIFRSSSSRQKEGIWGILGFAGSLAKAFGSKMFQSCVRLRLVEACCAPPQGTSQS